MRALRDTTATSDPSADPFTDAMLCPAPRLWRLLSIATFCSLLFDKHLDRLVAMALNPSAATFVPSGPTNSAVAVNTESPSETQAVAERLKSADLAAKFVLSPLYETSRVLLVSLQGSPS